MRRPPPTSVQLQLDFDAHRAPARVLTPELFLLALRQRRVRRVQRVRFKENRARIITLGRDGATLHVHGCFAAADEAVLDAVAMFLKADRRTTVYREAVRQMREFWTMRGVAEGWGLEEDYSIINGVRQLPCTGSPEQRAFLRESFARYNLLHFAGALPQEFPIRISDRMASRFGHMRYHTMQSGQRIVLELALNQNLFRPGHESYLMDTLLHEMTHVEAWLRHAHRSHGSVWRRIARRVGCDPHASCTKVIRRRRRGAAPLTRVPDRAWLPALPALAHEGAA
jgi:hypothetical protein